MIIDFIPFHLGMQYEHWEFDLDSIDTHLQYDKYEYIKKDIAQLFGLNVRNIWLYFNLDILFQVELIFDSGEPIQAFIQLSIMLVKKYGKREMLSDENLTKISVTWKDNNKSLILEYSFNLNQVILKLMENKHIDIS